MTKGRRLFGSLKSLFAAPRSLDGRSSNGTSTCMTLGDKTGEEFSETELRVTSHLPRSGGLGAASPSSPTLVDSRRGLHRKLLAYASGHFVTPQQQPLDAGIAKGLHHSISDPCDSAQHCSGLYHAKKSDSECLASAAQRVPSVKVVSVFKPAPRSDASLPSRYESDSTLACSIGNTGGAISGPVALGSLITAKPLPVAVSSLPTGENRPCNLSPEAPVSTPHAGCDEGPPTGPMPQEPKTKLLALCPGVPQTMRRLDWGLEDFDVIRKLYKGSTSAVYKATCRRSGLPVALKVYFLSKVPSNVIHMIVREIKIHVKLMHKNIIMLYAAFQDEKRLVLVQEYAARGDLYGIHRAMNRRMTEAQLTALVLAPFMDALAYLHGKGICHRDIKPENILFTQDLRLVVADFGVSIDLNQERAVTRAGTLEYMAPEVERCPLKMLPEENKDKDSLAYTTAVDIWAVGVLAYELLVGFPPFVSDSAAAAAHGGNGAGAFLAAHATRRTLSFPALTSALARDFISQALAESPDERPTALQLSRHGWLMGVSAVGTSPQYDRRVSGQALGANVNAQHATSRLASPSLVSPANGGGAPTCPLVP